MATRDCHQPSTARDQGMTHRSGQEARRVTVTTKGDASQGQRALPEAPDFSTWDTKWVVLDKQLKTLLRFPKMEVTWGLLHIPLLWESHEDTPEASVRKHTCNSRKLRQEDPSKLESNLVYIKSPKLAKVKAYLDKNKNITPRKPTQQW